MPTPNYGYEKRQKELAKKRKKEDKLRARADRKTDPSQPDGEVMEGQQEDAVAGKERGQDPSSSASASG